MRLRFGRPSLPLLILFAIVIGIVFYYIDNSGTESSAPQAVTAPVSPVSVTSVPEEVTPVATATIATRFTASNRPEVPEDTSIFIPTAGIWSDVIQTYLDGGNWDIRNLRSNAGHLEGTAWVTQPGNVVISGHVELSSGLPGIFAELENIEIGDVVRIRSEGIEYTYVVIETYNTVPSDLQPLMPTVDDRLTLITCNSYDIVSNAYRERLIVVAERVS